MSFTPHIRRFVIALSVVLQLTGRTNGQTLPDSLLESGSVHGLLPGWPDMVADSLQLLLLDHAIALAEIEERRASFWYRLIPDVRVSANFGVQRLVFIDPSTFTPYVLPKDVYRLTVSLSLSEVFNFDKHNAASIQRQKLEVQRQLAARHLQQNAQRFHQMQRLLQHDLEVLKEQETLINGLLRYTEILFREGDIQFDALVRVRLQQLHIRQGISRLLLSLIPDNSNLQPQTSNPNP